MNVHKILVERNILNIRIVKCKFLYVYIYIMCNKYIFVELFITVVKENNKKIPSRFSSTYTRVYKIFGSPTK